MDGGRHLLGKNRFVNGIVVVAYLATLIKEIKHIHFHKESMLCPYNLLVGCVLCCHDSQVMVQGHHIEDLSMTFDYR